MKTTASFRIQKILIGLWAAIALGVGTHADDFVWQGTCDELWATCCPQGGDWHNNWFSGPIAGPCPGLLPSPGDHVDLLDNTVRLDQAVHVESFSTAGAIYLLPGSGIGHLWVDGTAVFDGVMHFEADVVSSAGTGRFEIKNLVEFNSGAAKSLTLTTMNISPFGRARVADPCEIRMDLADLSIITSRYDCPLTITRIVPGSPVRPE